MLKSASKPPATEQADAIAAPFACGIAHDVNNLLMVVRCKLEDLGAMVADPASRPLLDEIESAVLAAGELNQSLMSQAERPDADEIIDVAEAIRRTIPLLRCTLPRSIRVAFDIKSDPPMPVRISRSNLRRILLNTTANAADAMAGEGELRIRCRTRIRAGGHRGCRSRLFAELTVQDSGTGISRRIQSRVFEPLFTTKRTGRGLGLSIVREIVHAAGGRIELESRPRAGTRIGILLPCLCCCPGAADSAVPQGVAS